MVKQVYRFYDYSLCFLLDQLWRYWDENCNSNPVKIEITGNTSDGFVASVEHDQTSEDGE